MCLHEEYNVPPYLRSLASLMDESAGVKTKFFLPKLSSALFFLQISMIGFRGKSDGRS